MISTKPAPDLTSVPPLNHLEGSLQTLSRDELVMTHLPDVLSLARRLLSKLPPSVDGDDLRSAGILGLLDAAERFDASRGIRFRSYAEVRIKGAMLDYLRSLSWAPRRLHAQARELERVRRAIEGATGRKATVAELAGAMGMTLEQHHQLQFELNSIDLETSDELWGEENDGAVKGLAGESTSDPLAEVERREKVEMIQEALEGLNERQRVLLWLYYYEELTMKEVGAVLQVSESRASQIHSKALATIRGEIAKRMARQPERLAN